MGTNTKVTNKSTDKQVVDYSPNGLRVNDEEELTPEVLRIRQQNALRSASYRRPGPRESMKNEIPGFFEPVAKIDDYGESRYDEYGLTTMSNYLNYQDIRAENQPWYSKLFNGVTKGGITAVTTAAGIGGLVYGLIQGTINASTGTVWGDDDVTGPDSDKMKKTEDLNGFQRFANGIWNNPVSNALNDIQQWSEKALPNYYTVEEQLHPLSNIFSANFLADKLIKNTGFSVGALYGAAGVSKLLTVGKAASMPGWLRAGVSAAVSAGGEGSIEAINGTRDFLKLEYAKIDDAFDLDLTNTYQKEFGTQREDLEYQYYLDQKKLEEEYENNKGKQFVIIQTPLGEQQVDVALLNYRQKLQELEQAFNMSNAKIDLEWEARKKQLELKRDDAKRKLEEDAAIMGNNVLAANMVILTLNDLLQFGRVLSGGMKTANRTTKVFAETGKTEAKQSKKTAKKTGTTPQEVDVLNPKHLLRDYFGLKEARDLYGVRKGTAKAVFKGVVKGLIESGEEISQQYAQDVSGAKADADIMNYYKAMMDPEAEQGTAEWGNAFIAGWKKTFGEDLESTIEQGMLGFVTGFLGVPVFGKTMTQNEQTWGKLGGGVFGMQGGLIGMLNENKQRYARDQKIIEEINKRIQQPEFIEQWKGLIRHYKLSKEMDKALAEGNILEYINSEHSQLVNDITMFDNAGRLKDLIRFVKDITDESEENVEAVINATTIEFKKHPEVLKRKEELSKKIEETRVLIEQRKQELERLESSNTIQSENIFGDDQFLLKETLSHKIHYAQEEYKKAIKDYEDAVKDYEDLVNDNRKIGAFIDENGNEFDHEEVKKELRKNRDDLLGTIKKYRDAKRTIDEQTNVKLSTEQLSHLTWLKLHSDNFKDRAITLAKKIQGLSKDEGENQYNFLQALDKFAEDKIKEYTEKLSNTTNEKEKEKLETSIKNMEDLSNAINKNLTATKEKDLMGLAEQLVLYIKFLKEPDVKDNLNEYTKNNIPTLLEEILDAGKLYNAYSSYSRYLSDYMQNPVELEKKQEKAKDEVKKELEEKKDEDKVTDINNAKTFEEFRKALDAYDNKIGSKKRISLLNKLGSNKDNNQLADFAKRMKGLDTIYTEFVKYLGSLKKYDEQEKQIAFNALQMCYDESESGTELKEALSNFKNRELSEEEKGHEDLHSKANEIIDKFEKYAETNNATKAIYKSSKSTKPKDDEKKSKKDDGQEKEGEKQKEEGEEVKEGVENNDAEKEDKNEKEEKPKIAAGSSELDDEDIDELYESVDKEKNNTPVFRSWSNFVKYLFENLSALNGRQAVKNTIHSREKVEALDALGAYDFVEKGFLAKRLKNNNALPIFYIVPPKSSPLAGEILLGIKGETKNSIEVDGEKYQIVGVLGYTNNNTDLAATQFEKVKQQIAEEMKGKDETQYHVSEKFSNRVKKIYSGRIVKNESEEYRDLSEAIGDAKYGEDFVFAIKRNGELHFLDNKTVDGEVVHINAHNQSSNNSIWLYSKGSDGKWYPKSIRVKQFNSDEFPFNPEDEIDDLRKKIAEKNSQTKIFKEIKEACEKICNKELTKDERNEAINDLKSLLFFNDNSDIEIDDEGNVTMTNYKGEEFYNYETADEMLRTLVVPELFDLRFFVHDETSGNWIIDNNLIDTDLKQLQHVNTSFDMYLNDLESGKPIIETEENNQEGSGKPHPEGKDNAPTHTPVIINGVNYSIWSDNTVRKNGREVTDAKELAYVMFISKLVNGETVNKLHANQDVYVGRYDNDKEFGVVELNNGNFKILSEKEFEQAKKEDEEYRNVLNKKKSIKQLDELFKIMKEKNGTIMANYIIDLLKFSGIDIEFVEDDDALASKLDELSINVPSYILNADNNPIGVNLGDNTFILNKSQLNPYTTLNFYAGLWLKTVQKNNADLWESVQKVFKNDSKLKDLCKECEIEVEDFKDLPNDDKICYVVALFSSKLNHEKLEKYSKNKNGKLNGLAKNILDSIKQLWNWIGVKLFNMESVNNIEEVADRILYDLINKEKLIMEEELEQEPIDENIIGNENTKRLRDVFGWSVEELDNYNKLSTGEKAIYQMNVRKTNPLKWMMKQRRDGVFDLVHDLYLSKNLQGEKNKAGEVSRIAEARAVLDYFESKGKKVEDLKRIQSREDFEALYNEMKPDC